MTSRVSALVFTCAGLSTFVTIGTLASLARAEEVSPKASSLIAVVAAPGDRFGLRVQAELEALGFQTVLLDPAAEPASRASLEAAARKVGAIAAIRAIPSARGVEVWIADRVTGKTVLREIAGVEGSIDGDATLALSAVDLLRASLLEIALPPPAPRATGEVPAAPDLRKKMALPAPGALAERPTPTLHLSLAPGVLLSPGGFGAAASLDMGLAWMPSAHVGVSGFTAIPLTGPRVAGAAGSADLWVWLAGGGVRFVFTSRESRWAPSADVGVMAVSFRSTATPGEGFVAKAASAAAAAPFARAGIAFAVTPMLRLRADVLAGVIVQGVSVQLAKHEVATWGRPLVLPSVGLDFGWF